MKKAYSFILFLEIQFERGFDHLWRVVFGLPQAKRSLVTPQLYVGGQYSLRAMPKLKKLGVTGIVNMRMHSIHSEGKFEDMHIVHLPTPDLHAPTIDQLQLGVTFITNEIKHGGKVYVHCHWGEGRGPTMAIAYLMSTGMVYDDAVALIKKARPFIYPTTPQVARLKEFEKLQTQQK